jgi:hypothetical protein
MPKYNISYINIYMINDYVNQNFELIIYLHLFNTYLLRISFSSKTFN